MALYGSRLSNAIHVWKDNDPQSTRLLLNACPERFRHWEFAYLRRLADSNQRIWDFGLGRMAIDTLAVAPDGGRVAVASPVGQLQVLATGTGKSLFGLRFEKQVPFSVSFSPDSRRGAILLRKEAGSEGQSVSGTRRTAASSWPLPCQRPRGWSALVPMAGA